MGREKGNSYALPPRAYAIVAAVTDGIASSLVTGAGTLRATAAARCGVAAT
jgi:hypothetical protein